MLREESVQEFTKFEFHLHRGTVNCEKVGTVFDYLALFKRHFALMHLPQMQGGLAKSFHYFKSNCHESIYLLVGSSKKL